MTSWNKKISKHAGDGKLFALLVAAVAAVLILTSYFFEHTNAIVEPVENVASEQRTLPPQIEKALRLKSLGRRYRIPVLMYHYVEYVKDTRDVIRKSLDTRPDVFESQIKSMLDGGYTFLTVSEMSDVIDAKRDVPEKPVVLTFDDGYRDFYTDVFPILKKYKVKATAYISPGLLNKNNYMFNAQVVEIARSGLVEIGAHTVHHVQLTHVSPDMIKKEVADSRTMLEQRFKVPVVSFAYPYGSFNEQVVSAVKEAGFTTAASTVPGTEVDQAHRFFFFRIRAGERTGPELTAYIARASAGPGF